MLPVPIVEECYIIWSSYHLTILLLIIVINVTDLSSLTVTFRNLTNNANYEVAVTAGNSVGVGMTITKSIRTFPPMPPQSPTNSSNNAGSHVCITIGLYVDTYMTVVCKGNIE